MNDLQIKYVLALAEIRNFSEVARRLYVAQPAISRQVAAFEEEIGIKIFSRTKRNVYVTEQGRVIIKSLKTVCDNLSTAISAAKKIQSNEKRILGIGLLEGIDIGSIVAPAFRGFQDNYPEFSFSIRYLGHAELNASLRNGLVDIIFTFKKEASLHSEFDFIDICEYENVIVMHRNNPLAQCKTLCPSDLRDETFLVSASEGAKGFSDYIKNLCTKFNISTKQIRYLPDTETLFVNVEAGLGIAYLTKSPRITGHLFLRHFSMNGDSSQIVAAWKRGTDNRAIRMFADYLLEELQTDLSSEST